MREKSEKRLQNKDQRPFAKVKYVRMSPSKVRIVLDTVRGKKVEEAVAILANSPQSAAEVCLKLLKSAIANAENNKGLNRGDLIVDEAFATPGPTLKRINIRARGRADRLLKRTCHITMILGEAK
ncbi:MAG TPA: 50S ribosomal protein L22 [Candidatus Caccopulliclostridium gallistercoris]|uniref:Large ribosomal subunit protein uL22 n=1 Tax=Candidatus Caccopulliclostridium gallistercoris TaxID=2840719 RepID=A0A9D1NE77_9FIRM|nr:50S ribosomal protein L22 [Candidatus Caccopulliclostridium gallistercoris]